MTWQGKLFYGLIAAFAFFVEAGFVATAIKGGW